jgi:hypothetical protein
MYHYIHNYIHFTDFSSDGPMSINYQFNLDLAVRPALLCYQQIRYGCDETNGNGAWAARSEKLSLVAPHGPKTLNQGRANATLPQSTWQEI